MAFSVVMPALEMAQETGKLIAWRKKEGDAVSKGEPLLEIETDKAVMEVEAPADGVLAGVTGTIGADIPVGKTIAWIVAPGESLPAETESGTAAPAARAITDAPKEPVKNVLETSSAGSPRISPKARRLAKELNVEIASLRGTGPGGEILASDVQAASATVAAAGQNSPRVETLSAVGRLMAERTTQSWTTVPHFFVTRALDAGALNRKREELVERVDQTHSVRITHTDLLIFLTARVLLKHPRLNSSWTPEGIRLHDRVNMALAIAVNDGVIAAVIPHADRETVGAIAQQRQTIAERAKTGKLRPSDLADATFTVSNLGMFQVDNFSAIITPPQVAILAVGGISDRVIALEGKPVVRPMVTVTLSCDHRVVDGAKAALFLKDLGEAVARPEKLLE